MTTNFENNQVKFVAKLSSAGKSRKIITIPVKELDKVREFGNKPLLVILQPIL